MTTVCIEPQTAAQKEQAKILPPGAKAPDFTLHVTPDQCLSLSDLAGKPVVIAFYPADWSPVCGDQMTLYNEALPEFEKYGAEVLGISVDGAWCHDAFAKHASPSPTRRERSPSNTAHTARARDFCERALFVIDRNGVIAWSYLSPLAVNPGADGILQALEQLPA